MLNSAGGKSMDGLEHIVHHFAGRAVSSSANRLKQTLFSEFIAFRVPSLRDSVRVKHEPVTFGEDQLGLLESRFPAQAEGDARSP